MYRIKDRVRIATSIVLYAGALSYLFTLYGISPLTISCSMVLLLLVIVGKLLW